MNVDAVVSDKTKTTMLDLAGSPSFNYEAAAVSLNTANATRVSGNNTLRNINLSLEALGFTPGPTGFGADIANSILYALQGKGTDAALSGAAGIFGVVGSVAAKKIKVERAIDAGEDVYVGYRAVPVDETPINTPPGNDYKYMFGDSPPKLHVGGPQDEALDTFISKMENASSYDFEFGSAVDDLGYINAFRKGDKVIADRGQTGDLSVGVSKYATYVTSNPQSALFYAMGQGFNPNVPMKIIKYEIPVSELKRLEGIQLGDKTGPAFKSNDYFLKKLHNIGTGRTTPMELVGQKTKMGTVTTGEDVIVGVGYRDVVPRTLGTKGFSSTFTPGNNVSIFEGGLDAGYATILKGDNLDDLLKKYPEMRGTDMENIGNVRSLQKRNLSTKPRDYNFQEFSAPNFKQELIRYADFDEAIQEVAGGIDEFAKDYFTDERVMRRYRELLRESNL